MATPMAVAQTPAEREGEDAKEDVSSPPSGIGAGGCWEVAAFTAAERKAWPSLTLFELTPMVKRQPGAAEEEPTPRDAAALEASLRMLTRKQLQKLAKTLRISPMQATDVLVQQLAIAGAAVQLRGASAPAAASSDADAETDAADAAAAAAAEAVAKGKDRRRKLAGALRVEIVSPFGDEPRIATVDEQPEPAAVAEPGCNAQCRACKLPFYTASGNTDCVSCRPPPPQEPAAQQQQQQQEEVDEEDIVCMRCSSGDAEDRMLLCEGCDNARHTFCCEPALAAVPSGDWFCGSCSASKPSAAVCRARTNLIQPVGSSAPAAKPRPVKLKPGTRQSKPGGRKSMCNGGNTSGNKTAGSAEGGGASAFRPTRVVRTQAIPDRIFFQGSL